jgi:hypothetical protein
VASLLKAEEPTRTEQLIAGQVRDMIFVTHAAPEDNEFALWLSSKLALAGYKVWVDRRRLRGGNDFWDEIDRVLRNNAIKQIVVFTHHASKPGVKKELAIGDIMKGRLGDPNFMIPIRADDVSFGDAPPELIRRNILNAYPNWHDCLAELFEALIEETVPCTANAPDAASLAAIITAREDGRRQVIDRPESVLSNWFSVTPPLRIRFYRFEGLQEHMTAWLKDCRVPHVVSGRLVGSFADPAAFAESSSFDQRTPTGYDVLLADFLKANAPPRDQDWRGASNDIVSLLRQHFSQLARSRGLLKVEFANGEEGWFFPDELIDGGKITFRTEGGRRIQRTMSGKFKDLRWHVCLIARPRIRPSVVYRIHANVVLSKDGRTPLPGDRTHKRRRRLTKSWWNDVWRDRLLAAMRFLADGQQQIALTAGNECFSVATWPYEAHVPVSYDANDPPLPTEEDDEGNFTPSTALDDQLDEGDPDDDSPDGP